MVWTSYSDPQKYLDTLFTLYKCLSVIYCKSNPNCIHVILTVYKMYNTITHNTELIAHGSTASHSHLSIVPLHWLRLSGF